MTPQLAPKHSRRMPSFCLRNRSPAHFVDGFPVGAHELDRTTTKKGLNMSSTRDMLFCMKTGKRHLLSEAALAEAAECLKTVAHPTRIRILQLLLSGRYTVGELAEACGVASNLASEHLRLMERAGLLAREREGKCTYYGVADPHLERLMACIEGRFGS